MSFLEISNVSKHYGVDEDRTDVLTDAVSYTHLTLPTKA